MSTTPHELDYLQRPATSPTPHHPSPAPHRPSMMASCRGLQMLVSSKSKVPCKQVFLYFKPAASAGIRLCWLPVVGWYQCLLADIRHTGI
jgi:hypothetical protein